jgi:hypothetical protein
MRSNTLLALATCLLPSFGSAATNPQFQPYVDYAAGLKPSALRLADVNDDGHLDALVANGGSDTVSVLLGNGDGTFKPRKDYRTGDNPGGVAVADMDRDGFLDVIVSNLGKADPVSARGTTVSLFRGNGNGSFKAKQDYAVGAMPWGLDIGDLNRDGVPDIATANYLEHTISVLYGVAAGGFSPKVDWPTDYTPREVRIGDLNRDGKPDLITTNYGGGSGRTISVLLGKGNDSGFIPTVNRAVPQAPTSVQFGDINRDGKPDVVVTSYTDPKPTVNVLFGTGLGNFASRAQYAMNGRPGLQLVDLNRDGWLDFAAAHYSGVSLMLSDGLGGFQTPVDYATGAGATALGIGDLNHDGKPDLVTANESVNSVSVLLGL